MIIWAVGRFIASLSKKKSNSGGSSNKQRQAVEEQQRRRAAYEVAKKEQNSQPRQADTLEQLGRMLKEGIPTAVLPQERHHIDEIEEERCAEAEQVRQERRKQELRERFGAPAQQPARRTVQRNAQRPKTLTQAQRQLYAPIAPPASPLDQVTTAASPLTAQGAPAAPHQRHIPAADDSQVRRGGVSLQGNALVQGIIMAEVLGPPRSKKRLIR